MVLNFAAIPGSFLPFHLNLEICLELVLSTKTPFKKIITAISALLESSNSHDKSFKMEPSSTLQLEQVTLGDANEL